MSEAGFKIYIKNYVKNSIIKSNTLVKTEYLNLWEYF